MTRRRKIVLAVALCLAALAGAVMLLPGAFSYVALIAYVAFYESRHPETISWDAKNAFVKCPGAIADPRQWPARPDAACAAMHLCANKGALSSNQVKALYAQIGRLPAYQQP